MAKQKIRIRLKAYEHRVLDESADKIVNTAKRTGAQVSVANWTDSVHGDSFTTQVQEVSGTIRNAYAQASDRHHRPNP